MSKTNSRKPKLSVQTKKRTSEKKSTPKHPNKWGVFINSNHVTDPSSVKWDIDLECYCTEEDTFEEPHGFVFSSKKEADLFVSGARAARQHIARMLGMELEEYNEDSIQEEEQYDSLTVMDETEYILDR